MAEKKGKGKNGNLRSADMLTEEELRRMASNGGKKSVEVRRQRKKMKEVLKSILYDVEPPEAWKQRMLDEGFTEDEVNHQLIVTMGLVKKAEGGDVFAYQTICQMLGEKPADKLDLNGKMDTKIEIGFVESGVEPMTSEDEVDAER